jgi:hypothetical protein
MGCVDYIIQNRTYLLFPVEQVVYCDAINNADTSVGTSMVSRAQLVQHF